MEVQVFATPQLMAAQAAQAGAKMIRQTLEERGEATIVVATGASQIDMLAELTASPELDWSRVTAFHLDEYVGISAEHPASFRNYLRTRFVEQLPIPLRAFHYLHTEGDCQLECERVGAILASAPVDVAFVGIGENGHLAFNDPPADFEATQPFLCVDLDEACRRQQLREGWFPTMEAVPKRAITMSIRQIMSSRQIVCTVPHEQKAIAVRNTLQGGITPEVPASILQSHERVHLFLDAAAASLLDRNGGQSGESDKTKKANQA